MLAGVSRSHGKELASSLALNRLVRHVSGSTLNTSLPSTPLHGSLHCYIAQQQASKDPITRWSSYQPTPTNLSELCQIGLSDDKRAQYCRFLRKELCIRLAQSAAHLQFLPHGWANEDPFRGIIDLHLKAIKALEGCSSLGTEKQLERFSDVLRSIFQDMSTVGSVPEMLHGLKALSSNCESMPQEVNKVLLNFFTLRTGMRFLIQHQMESHPRQARKWGYSGILQLQCSPAQVAKLATKDSTTLCRSSYGRVPRIIVQGDVNATLTYVPAVLRYMLTEVFKNSCRAVVERHTAASSDELPPITCNISGGLDGGMTVKISDDGCGMNEQRMDRMWDFLYTTCEGAAWKGSKSSGVLAGYGVGLPLSRMYARYFGGEMTASSKEGCGTEVSIHLSRTTFQREALPSVASAHTDPFTWRVNGQGAAHGLNGNMVMI